MRIAFKCIKLNCLLLCFLMGFNLLSWSQDEDYFSQTEQQLKQQLDVLRSTPNTDRDSLIERNQRFKVLLEAALNHDESFNYPFSALHQSVGFIKSDDGLIRIINWNIEYEDFSMNYFGFIQKWNPRTKKTELIELVDNPMTLSPRTDLVLDPSDWYGALYYQIVTKSKGNKIYYTLLGFDGHLGSSNIKVIDVLTFSGNKAKLGAPIFNTKEGVKKRVVFEFSEKATMSLKFETRYDRIVFDHLAPESPNLKGFYAYYVPDMSYDAYVFTKDKWLLKEDVIAVNGKESRVKTVYVKNEKTGKLEEKEIKNEFLEPDPNNPLEKVTPEELSEDQKNNQNASKKKQKLDERDPSQMQSTLGTGKKKRKRRR